MNQSNSLSKADIHIYKFLKFYVFLLIFEGIFRKWIQLSSFDVFYFARDLLTLIYTLKLFFINNNSTFGNPEVRIILNTFFLIFSLYGFIAVLIQNIPLVIVLFGVRNYISVLFVVYICSFIRDKSLIFENIYRIFLLSLFMQFPIVLFQIFSSPDSFVNKTSWVLGASVFTSGGFVRPPGTFTNALGLGYFILIAYGLILSSLLKGFNSRKAANFNLIALFIIFIIVSISGSRTVLLGILLTTIIYFYTRLKYFLIKSKKYSSSKNSYFIILLFMIGLFIIALTKLTDAINAFIFRLQYQTEGGSGTLNRIFDSIFGYNISNISFFGGGIGTRHQSALALNWIEPWVENETLRWSAEIGIMGLVLIFVKQIWISYLAVKISISKVNYDYLSPIFFAALGPFLFSGISTQPTIQGMSAIMLCFLVYRKYI